jgi:hypothetical protein
MNQRNAIGGFLLAATSSLLLAALPAAARDEDAPAPRAGMPMDASDALPFDWLRHTQATLSELRAKLNLATGQEPAWQAWSAGVIGDAHEQLSSKAREAARDDRAAGATSDETTPARMARGIERLREQTAWMQGQLVRLEAAQARTRTFYDALDTNQRTIFDLFWHEMHHRAFGHDDDIGMRREGGDPMMGGRVGPPAAY